MNVLIIGYGSIGRRHDEVLQEIDFISQVNLINKQNIKDRVVYKSLEDVEALEYYDYFVIASETSE